MKNQWKEKRKKFLFFLSLFLLILYGAGCGRKGGHHKENHSVSVEEEKSYQKEKNTEKEIVVAVLKKTGSLQDFLNDFNSYQDDYRVKLVSYEDYEDPQMKLKSDISEGNAPDIVSCSWEGQELLDYLDNKGLSEDLTPYLDSDPEIDAEDLMETPLNLLKTDGKLTRIASGFGIFCTAGSRKVIGDRLTWNWEDYGKICRKEKEKNGKPIKNFYGAGAFLTWRLAFFCSWQQYMDISTGEVRFNEENFIKPMEMLKEFEDYGNTGNNGEEFVRDFFLLNNLSEICDEEYLKEKKGHAIFEKDDLQLMGYPANEGNGIAMKFPQCFAVLASSGKKEGAWQLLSSFWKYDEKTRFFEGLPMRKSRFEYIKACAMSKKRYWVKDKKYSFMTPDGELKYYEEVIPSMPKGLEVTEKQMKNIEKIIDLADIRYLPDHGGLYDIIINMSTGKTAQEAAEELQEQIRSYLNENM